MHYKFSVRLRRIDRIGTLGGEKLHEWREQTVSDWMISWTDSTQLHYSTEMIQ